MGAISASHKSRYSLVFCSTMTTFQERANLVTLGFIGCFKNYKHEKHLDTFSFWQQASVAANDCTLQTECSRHIKEIKTCPCPWLITHKKTAFGCSWQFSWHIITPECMEFKGWAFILKTLIMQWNILALTERAKDWCSPLLAQSCLPITMIKNYTVVLLTQTSKIRFSRESTLQPIGNIYLRWGLCYRFHLHLNQFHITNAFSFLKLKDATRLLQTLSLHHSNTTLFCYLKKYTELQ